MARCISWRYHPTLSHESHLPGWCRECWAPCTEPVTTRGERCTKCLQAILACPDHRVRRVLLEEPHLDRQTLEMLAQDQYPMIAFGAQQLLGETTALPAQDPVQPPFTPEQDGRLLDQ